VGPWGNLQKPDGNGRCNTIGSRGVYETGEFWVLSARWRKRLGNLKRGANILDAAGKRLQGEGGRAHHGGIVKGKGRSGRAKTREAGETGRKSIGAASGKKEIRPREGLSTVKRGREILENEKIQSWTGGREVFLGKQKNQKREVEYET